MNKMKKLLSVTLIAVSLISLAACGGSAKNSSSGDTTSTTSSSDSTGITFPLKEPVKMTMLAMSNSGVNLNDTLAFKKLTEMTNVQWTIQSVTGNDLDEKKNLLLASNQYPDVFMKVWLDQSTLDKYGSQGTFIALNDLIKKDSPNISKLLSERTGVQDLITSRDGNIYSLPEIDSPSTANNFLFINQKWLTKLNLKMPTSLDELYNDLEAFKENDPNGNGKADEIPITFSTGTSPTLLLPYFGITCDSATMTADIDGKYQYVSVSDKYKELLTYLTKLYKNGLMDKNSFTQTKDQQDAIGASGDTLGCFFNAGAFLTVGRDRDADFPALQAFQSGVFPTSNGASVGTFAITDKCENPDIAMAWVDILYSEEGGRLAWMGVENQSYKINSDGTWDWVLGSYSDVSKLRPATGIQGAATHPSVQPEIWPKNTSDVNEVKIYNERAAAVANGAKPFPSLKFSESDNKTIASVCADINPYVSQYMAQVVTGHLDLDKSWQDYVNKLDAMGLPQLMDIYTKAYNAATK